MFHSPPPPPIPSFERMMEGLGLKKVTQAKKRRISSDNASLLVNRRGGGGVSGGAGSVALSPSNSQKIALEQNDDVAERAARRKHTDGVKENGHNAAASNVVANSDKSQSKAKVLDNRQLADLYSTCINMSTENVTFGFSRAFALFLLSVRTSPTRSIVAHALINHSSSLLLLLLLLSFYVNISAENQPEKRLAVEFDRAHRRRVERRRSGEQGQSCDDELPESIVHGRRQRENLLLPCRRRALGDVQNAWRFDAKR
jgi:hypothetical protein